LYLCFVCIVIEPIDHRHHTNLFVFDNSVEVVYPLSENTVLVIQQLFSNLLSALFIPVFKALRDVGTIHDESENRQFPHYTFSFYCLIVIFAAATCYFATFNGAYLRYEAEEAKKAKKEEERDNLRSDLHQHHHGIGYGSLGTN
jgi:magnesium-transporting ATPase (P-type)